MKNTLLVNTFIQLMKYGVVGGIAFVADYSLLYLLTEYCGLYHLLSAAISFMVGLTVNYVLSLRYVFTERSFKDKRMEFAAFAIIGIIGLLLNELILYVSADVCGLHYMAGKVVSTVIVFFWNFLARKIILFTV